MLFYPIEYFGLHLKRFENVPYGLFGWQGVVPCKTEKMALRLVDIVTRDLLSLKEAFGRIDNTDFANLISDSVYQSIHKECGVYWAVVLKPILPYLLTKIVGNLKEEIEDVLDLPSVVLNAFVRDKVVLVELFQKVGRVELNFLVESGFGFGFLLGLGQMLLWAKYPRTWTLPVAGSFVGYITNWVAINLLFEPAEPVNVGPLTLQGLFESRQKEVSEEFAHFMESRVLSSSILLDALSNQNEQELFDFLRRQLPFPVPEKVIRAAIKALSNVANNPEDFEEVHAYMKKRLNIEDTLCSRLQQLNPKSFENLLHPVFQEDEIILIVVGGLLGALAGLLQTKLSFSGPNARSKAMALLIGCLASSTGFFMLSDDGTVNDDECKKSHYDAVIDRKRLSRIRRHNTVVRTVYDDDDDNCNDN